MTLQDLGESIREKREAAGLSIDDVAARIKVSARALKAIEGGSMEGLPHAVYTKGFVRSFALVVGFNPDELNERLSKVFPAEAFDDAKPEPGPISRSLPTPGMGKKIVMLLLVLCLLAGLAAGGWYVTIHYGATIMEIVKQPFSAVTIPAVHTGSAEQKKATSTRADVAAPLPGHAVEGTAPSSGSLSQLAVATSAPTSPASAGVDASAARRSVNATAVAPQAALRNATASAPRNATTRVTQTAPRNATLVPALEVPPAVSSEVNQLYVKALQDCYISSRADGVKGRAFILDAGKEFVLTYKSDLELSLGNAGGVELYHNGKPLGKAGQQGQVKTLQFP